MKNKHLTLLVLNGGSSSIKFALYSMNENSSEIFSGQIKRIGLDSPEFSVTNAINNETNKFKIEVSNVKEAAEFFIDWLKKQNEFDTIACVGHRIVHGMKHTEAQIIDEYLLKELDSISDYDPDHLPAEIEMVRLIKKHFPSLMQVACFDTAFHTTIPLVAKTVAIPKKYYEEGVHRYGFHGISYSYLMGELRKQNKEEANGKIILAHLGNGASLAAVKNGKCIDTSMGFTPAGGVPMSTRSGDLDPGIAWYLMHKGMDAKQFIDLINHQSGLLGISGVSSDMQDLLDIENENKDAALAIDMFCYQIKKYIGGYTAALGGLDVLVFSGGIGELAPAIRTRICNELGYLNIHLNEENNNNNQWQISNEESKVKVYVIPTNEELMIAKTAFDLYDKNN
jgi:acetate kinase